MAIAGNTALAAFFKNSRREVSSSLFSFIFFDIILFCFYALESFIFYFSQFLCFFYFFLPLLYPIECVGVEVKVTPIFNSF